MEGTIRTGAIGCGYYGPNLVRAMVGAGSVVTRYVPPVAVVACNPACALCRGGVNGVTGLRVEQTNPA